MDASVTIRLSGLAMPKGDGKGIGAPTEIPATEADLSDEALMDQVCQGGREALAVLFRRYARLVHTISNRILRDSSEADDLLQEVFLFILSQERTVRQVQELRPLLDCSDHLPPRH